jgi:predicted AAA+ superfamily ATPase
MVFHVIRKLLDEGVDPTSILYLSMETPIYTGLSLEQLIGFFQKKYSHKRRSKLYIFFDEIQYLKNWEIHLKSLVDSYPDYKLIVTGSAAAALRLKSIESGAGRFSDFILPPLTFAEYLMFINKEDKLIQVTNHAVAGEQRSKYSTNYIEELNFEFINYLNFGGYPEAVFSETIRLNTGQFIKSDIIDKVLLRDLPSLYGISDIQELNRLFTVIAYNSGCEVSLDNLSKSSGVAKNTIKRYLEYLEAAFLIMRVERIDQNAKRFKRAMTFKVYLTNPSMRAALFGKIDADAEAIGNLTETAIFSQWQHNQSQELFYARWNKGEVDIVCLASETQSIAWAVEVKWSDGPYSNHSELKNCVELALGNPHMKQPILVTSRTVSAHSILYNDVLFTFQPASVYAYTLGANILKRWG